MQAIELFAGAGGLGMGISKAGFHPAEVVEWDKWCCDTIRENRRSRSAIVAHSQDALLWEQAKSQRYWERHEVAKIGRIMDARLQARGMALKEKPRAKPWATVRDAFIDLPDPEFAPELASKFHNHRFQPGARSYVGHTGSPLDEPAKTLKAGVHGVPGGENMLCRPDGSVRYFSVRESARLQTFPDSYRLHGSWTESMRQLGNAVPVKLAEIIGRNVASHLEDA